MDKTTNDRVNSAPTDVEISPSDDENLDQLPEVSTIQDNHIPLWNLVQFALEESNNSLNLETSDIDRWLNEDELPLSERLSVGDDRDIHFNLDIFNSSELN